MWRATLTIYTGFDPGRAEALKTRLTAYAKMLVRGLRLRFRPVRGLPEEAWVCHVPGDGTVLQELAFRASFWAPAAASREPHYATLWVLGESIDGCNVLGPRQPWANALSPLVLAHTTGDVPTWVPHQLPNAHLMRIASLVLRLTGDDTSRVGWLASLAIDWPRNEGDVWYQEIADACCRGATADNEWAAAVTAWCILSPMSEVVSRVRLLRVVHPQAVSIIWSMGLAPPYRSTYLDAVL